MYYVESHQSFTFWIEKFHNKKSQPKGMHACMPTLLDISGSLPDMTPIPSLRYRLLYVRAKIIFWAAILDKIKWNSKPAYPAKSRMKLCEGKKTAIFHPWFGGEGVLGFPFILSNILAFLCLSLKCSPFLAENLNFS